MIFKNKKNGAENESGVDDEEYEIGELSPRKITMTNEIKRRKEAEYLRKLYDVPPEKTAILLKNKPL